MVGTGAILASKMTLKKLKNTHKILTYLEELLPLDKGTKEQAEPIHSSKIIRNFA